MFIVPDLGTLLVQLVNFAIFFALLNVVFLRPVGRAIAKRRAYIESVGNDYARYQAEGKALRERADRIRGDARREATATVAAARAEASNQTAKLAAEYNARASATVEDAQAKAQAELDRARAGEPELVARLADSMLERTLGTVAP